MLVLNWHHQLMLPFFIALTHMRHALSYNAPCISWQNTALTAPKDFHQSEGLDDGDVNFTFSTWWFFGENSSPTQVNQLYLFHSIIQKN
jgi:hypothetical protein